ncbi:hypothetical protein B0T24DRAFT_711818 [Lasiosphaeria ovina]|uniref:Uncharacterized protein n=1 Tax=Lasiosphaeria ovina TaxID=92902 RepID=A0AAE0JYB2_9PEZI|nr:hypothetical protein B0T24DRAFT_711818 [Lasiosphaeria ovina]
MKNTSTSEMKLFKTLENLEEDFHKSVQKLLGEVPRADDELWFCHPPKTFMVGVRDILIEVQNNTTDGASRLANAHPLEKVEGKGLPDRVFEVIRDIVSDIDKQLDVNDTIPLEVDLEKTEWKVGEHKYRIKEGECFRFRPAGAPPGNIKRLQPAVISSGAAESFVTPSCLKVTSDWIELRPMGQKTGKFTFELVLITPHLSNRGQKMEFEVYK